MDHSAYKTSKKTKAKIIIVSFFLMILSIVGITYAYFSVDVSGNEEASSIIISAANLELIYNDVQMVSGEYAKPGWTQTKTLTVENTGTDTVEYIIKWRELINTVTNDELVISATCTSSIQGNTCENILEMPVPYTEEEIHDVYVFGPVSIDPGEIQTYTVTALFKETGGIQNYNQNKYFNGTLNLGSIVNLEENKYKVVYYQKLPDEYQELEYIESDGNQYILTDIYPDNQTGVYTKIAPKNVTSDRLYFGVGSVSNNRYWAGTINGYFYYGWNSYNNDLSMPAQINATYNVYFNYLNNRKFIVNDFGPKNLNGTASTKTNPMSILGYNNGTGVVLIASTKLYEFKVTQDKQLIDNFIPCYRKSDDATGLYDMVTKAFYTNDGTGTFTRGNEVTNEYHVVNEQILIRGLSQRLSLNTYTDSYLSFVEWNTQADGNGDSYSSGEVVYNLTNNDSINLYAQWGRKVRVTFDANGGTISESSKDVFAGYPYGTLPTPTRNGYTFLGWNGKNIFDFGTSDDYWTSIEMTIDSNEKSISAIKTNNWSGDYWRNEKNQYGSGTYTLSATFSGQTNPIHIIFLYDSNGNIIDNSNLSISGFTWNSYYNGWYSNRPNVTVTIPSSVSYWKYGSAFTGNANTSGKISDIIVQNGSATSTEYESYYVTSSTNVTQTENHTLTAIWEEITYTITLQAGYGISNMSLGNANGATIVKTMHYGDTIDLSQITKTYLTDFSGTVYSINSGAGSISNTTYTVGDGNATILIDPATPRKCYCNNGTQTQGTTCNIGVFTYRYKGKMGTGGTWSNITNDGWGVALTSRTSTDPVTETMCGYINDKPLVSIQYAFYNSNATSIDVTNYYTKNVTIMIGMFDSAKTTEIIGLSNLNVSKATSLFRVFRSMSNITTLDLTGWDTTSGTITNFGNMFNSSSNLRTIYASNTFVITSGAQTTSMFGNCASLVGGAGTHYDGTYITGARAKIDGGQGDEGYFTQGPPPSNP